MNLFLRDSTAFLVVVVLTFASLTSGCSSAPSTQASQAATAQNAGQGAAQNPLAQQMSVDELVAPIALYPDQLLAQVLTTAVNPQEVLDLGNWLLQNQSLQGDAMTNAAKQAGFSASAQYLALFPQVVDNMCQQMDWTRELGEAFKADQKGVMDAVQRKRTQAQQMGNLTSSPQMTVATKQADNGQQYVEIQPADPKTVYVPAYNPVTIYTTPAPAPAAAQTTTTTSSSSEKSGVSTGGAIAIGLLSFGVGMAVGSAIHHDDYYPYPSWGYGGVYYGGHPYYPPPYRPPVYPGYRPVYGYNPPSNYRWNQYNHNVNVNVNNNYYNRFNNTNANVRPGYGGGGTANPRLAQNDNNWKGQSTYQGARPNATQGQRAGASMATAVPRNEQYGNRSNQVAANRPGGSPGGVNLAANRSNMGNAGATNMASRPAAQPNMNRGGDRGYGAASNDMRSGSSASPAGRPGSAGDSPHSRPNAGGPSAFGGGSTGSGRSEHAASDRGRSSMGAASAGRGHRR
jgi:hypothetical protein